MLVGLNLPVTDPTVDAAELMRLAQLAEVLGYHEVYLGEHVVLFDEQTNAYLGEQGRAVPFSSSTNLPDPLLALAFLAAGTTRIRLATGVLVLPQRNPVYTAKHAASLDWLSGGRLDLAVGIGWSSLEYRATATSWERRGARCEEYVDILRALWSEGVAEFTGELYQLPPCHQYPKPVQRPGPPIWFGGASEAALRRVAARGEGWYAFDTPPAKLAEKVHRLRQLAESFGRDLEALTVVHGCMQLVPRNGANVRAYADAGVHQLVVSLPQLPSDQRDRHLETLAMRVLG
jgi:probable F420-dependent oxidoreductase